MPPVSISSKKRGSVVGADLDERADAVSRVTPATSSTMAMRRPASQLKREDLPTLGRPTITTLGRGIVRILSPDGVESVEGGAEGGRGDRGQRGGWSIASLRL